ncbi:hypothetical protein PQ610_03775 [Tardisphaera miroshnichenkoae]
MEVSSLNRLERELQELSASTQKLTSQKYMDQRAGLAELYISLSSFMAHPNKESQQRCLEKIDELVKQYPYGNEDVGKKLIALGMILIAAPEPITTVIGIAMVAAGKRMESGKST